MKNNNRPYYRTSSFKMAMLFTIILGLATAILGYFIYYFYSLEHGILISAVSNRAMKWLAGLSIVFMLIVIIISFSISVFVVSRTNRIALIAKEIMDTGNLSRRIDVDSRWDDLSYVAQVLNAFLARVELLVENVRQVSDNIAHDLRTPLTRLRNDLEKLRDGQDKSPEQFERVVDESDRILIMFAALLRISNIEAGQEKHKFEKTDLKEIILDVADLYEPLAEAKNISIKKDISEGFIEGDRDLLFQAFANLIDNAIKFTPSKGMINLTLSATDGGFMFRIADTGPGIAETDKEKIFHRFYRAETSRNTQGNGLGLSMVDAVIRLHSGKISVKNARPGLSIEITFVLSM